MSLTPQQTHLIQTTLPLLHQHGERLTTIFYTNLLAAHPSLHHTFNHTNQTTGRQPRALTTIILAFASRINNLADLAPRLERTCHKHCSLGIQPAQYDLVGTHLLAAFAEVLGPGVMTPEVEAAWRAAYGMLARMLIGREAQMYRGFGAWDGWRRLRVARREAECEGVVSLYLAHMDGRPLPEFQPGQYVSVRVEVPRMGRRQARQYALSDAPRGEYYRISVKRDEGRELVHGGATARVNPGVVSNLLVERTKVGDELEVSHPAGEVFLDMGGGSNVPVVLISAGIGITPMMSILNSVSERQPTRPIAFIHGSTNAMPFQEQMTKLKSQKPAVRRHIFKSKPGSDEVAGVQYDHTGRVDLATLSSEDLFLGNNSAEYYISGPEQFMVEMSEYLAGKGVSSSRMKFELFTTGELAAKKPAQMNGTSTANGSAESGAHRRANSTHGALDIAGLNGLNSHPVGYPFSRASAMNELWREEEANASRSNSTRSTKSGYLKW